MTTRYGPETYDSRPEGYTPARTLIRINAEKDPAYRPYCMRCLAFARMQIAERFYWVCPCGAEHDERMIGETAPASERIRRAASIKRNFCLANADCTRKLRTYISGHHSAVRPLANLLPKRRAYLRQVLAHTCPDYWLHRAHLCPVSDHWSTE